jgi:hypothetical protein
MGCGLLNCNIDTVIIHGTTKQAMWGLSVKTATVIDVTSENNTLAAFVLDSHCQDNTGSATLRFQKAK